MISAAAQYDERVPQHVDCTSDRYMNFEILVQILADTDARGGIAAEAKNVPTWRLLKVSPGRREEKCRRLFSWSSAARRQDTRGEHSGGGLRWAERHATWPPSIPMSVQAACYYCAWSWRAVPRNPWLIFI